MSFFVVVSYKSKNIRRKEEFNVRWDTTIGDVAYEAIWRTLLAEEWELTQKIDSQDKQDRFINSWIVSLSIQYADGRIAGTFHNSIDRLLVNDTDGIYVEIAKPATMSPMFMAPMVAPMMPSARSSIVVPPVWSNYAGSHLAPPAMLMPRVIGAIPAQIAVPDSDRPYTMSAPLVSQPKWVTVNMGPFKMPFLTTEVRPIMPPAGLVASLPRIMIPTLRVPTLSEPEMDLMQRLL